MAEYGNPNSDFKALKAKKSNSNSFQDSHGKIPPQATDLEEAVLGAMMLEKDALTAVIDILTPETFYKEAHQKIFAAIFALFARSEPVDILTVTQELKSSGDLEIVGGAYYITQLTNRIASAANIEFHARIISQKYIQRELIRISSEIIKDAFEESTDVFDLLDKAEQSLFAISENNLRRNFDSMQQLVAEAIQNVENARHADGGLSGVPSGFTELDRVTSGWQRSDLVILAARPGMGKTAFTLSMARNMAVDFNKGVALFSLEMAAVQLVTRLISSETRLPGEKLKKGNLESYEWEQLNSKVTNLITAPIFIDDTPALSIFELRAKCRRLKAQHDIQIIMIDYLQLMTAGGDKGNREQEISTISRSLKALAKELMVPIICLSQLNRSVETRGGSKKPLLSDLRESGAIEQDADMVIFIYRPEYYGIEEDENGGSTHGIAEICIAKHRNGALKDVPLRFIADHAQFCDLESNDYGGNDSIAPNTEFDTPSDIVTIPSKMNEMDGTDEEDVPF